MEPEGVLGWTVYSSSDLLTRCVWIQRSFDDETVVLTRSYFYNQYFSTQQNVLCQCLILQFFLFSTNTTGDAPLNNILHLDVLNHFYSLNHVYLLIIFYFFLLESTNVTGSGLGPFASQRANIDRHKRIAKHSFERQLC